MTATQAITACRAVAPAGAKAGRFVLSLVFVACLCTAVAAADKPRAPANPAKAGPHVLASASSQLPLTEPAAFTISNEDVTHILEDRVDHMHKGVGIVVGLVDQVGMRVVSYGTTDRKSHQPVNGDSVFEIGSITKLFTAILLADMVERGEVRLDDPISKYLPDGVRAPTRNGKEITLAHLSTHMSGLPRDPGNLVPLWARLCFWCDASGILRRYSVDDLFAYLSHYTLKRDIGAESEYSNFAVSVLGQLLARQAGTDFATLVRTRITDPLGMTDTAILTRPDMLTRLAHGHSESLKPTSSWYQPGGYAAAGGLKSTVNDMLKFAAANLGLRPSPVLAAMRRSHQPNETAKMQMGLGWGINRPFDADIRRHSGGTDGYITYLGIDLTRRRGVVVLSNTANDITDIGEHLLESRVPLVQEHTAIKLNSKTLDAYVGAYQMQPDVVLTVSRRGDRLFGHRGNQGGDQERLEIFAETETEFFFKAINAQLTFTKDSAGRITQVVIHHASGQDETGPKIK
jgi:CubicO group peptidase (beta-lactamase class C family)